MKKFLIIKITSIIIIWLLFGITVINNNENGVVFLFGKITDTQLSPGIHYILPYPIETVEKVPVKQVANIVVDDFSESQITKGKGAQYQRETRLKPYCITGDNNIVTIEVTVKYTVWNPVNYLTLSDNVEEIIHNITSQEIIKNTAIYGIDEILTYGKQKLASALLNNIGSELEKIGSGISLSFIDITAIQPPKEIQPAFDDVVNAKVEINKEIYNAEAYRNRIIPQARSKADTKIKESESYAKNEILIAEGETERFSYLSQRYDKDKEGTAMSLYFDLAASIFSNAKEIKTIYPDGKKSDKMIIDM